MKLTTITTTLLASAALIQAEVIEFNLSPPGTSGGTGLSPLNENPPVETSDASGDEIGAGISLDTETGILTYALGYGSLLGFSDLSGPAAAAHIHGPAAASENAGVLFNLADDHVTEGPSGVILGSVELTPEQAAELLAGMYYVNIHTELNPGGEIRGQLIPMINTAPELVCAEDIEVECESPDGTPVNLQVDVADADGDALTVVWTVDGTPYQTNMVAGTEGGTSETVNFTATFGFGTHTVDVSVSDGTAEAVTCSSSVTVVDTTPPVVRRIGTNPSVLWPPNHKMVPVQIRVAAEDNCGRTVSRIVRAVSNEPDNGIGDGNTTGDIEITGPMTLNLRAERSGRGDGRVYTILVETTDRAGNSTSNRVRVLVPHDQGGGRDAHPDADEDAPPFFDSTIGDSGSRDPIKQNGNPRAASASPYRVFDSNR